MQITQPASIFPHSALRMVNGFIPPFGAFLCSVGAVSWFRQSEMLAPHFSPGAVNPLLAAATTISMRVVDKAFQLGQPSGDVRKKGSLTGNAELGGSQNL